MTFQKTTKKPAKAPKAKATKDAPAEIDGTVSDTTVTKTDIAANVKRGKVVATEQAFDVSNFAKMFDTFDAEIDAAKASKSERAVLTMAMVDVAIGHWIKSGDSTAYLMLLQRSEFHKIVRVITGHVFTNVNVTGKGRKTAKIVIDGRKAILTKDASGSTAARDMVSEFASGSFGINSAEVKSYFNIALSDADIVANIAGKLKRLAGGKIEGKAVESVLSADQMKSLNHLITLLEGEYQPDF